MKKTIFIDFDGTICPNKNSKNEYPTPSKECVETITDLFNAGHDIIIYSVRSNWTITKIENGHQKMIAYLRFHKIPFTTVDLHKPHFSMIIDDKCLGIPKDSNTNVDWKKAKTILKNKKYI